jgi:TonB family protein
MVMCALDLGKQNDAGAALPRFLGNQPTPEQIAEVRAVVAKAAAPPPSRNVVVRAPDGTEPPILLVYSGAAYPPDAREFGIGGSVRLDAIIGVDGTAKRIEMRPDGNWAALQQLGFEEAAVSAVKRWRFFPALLDGRPVDAELTVVGIFEMVE